MNLLEVTTYLRSHKMIEQEGKKININTTMEKKIYEPNELFDWICKKEGKGIYKCVHNSHMYSHAIFKIFGLAGRIFLSLYNCGTDWY